MNLARRLAAIQPHVVDSPWAGYAHYRGYALMVLPFSSGHMLGLRVFHESDLAPYTSVWHRTPQGDWSIYNDGPSLNTTCPRWWGPALKHAELTRIQLSWIGPNELQVSMERPRLVWTLSMSASPLLHLVNAVSGALPLWTRKRAWLRPIQEWMSKRLLGMGDLRFSFATPSEKDAIVAIEEVFSIESSRATLHGSDLGYPIRLSTNPTIGHVALPRRPVFVIVQAFERIEDRSEYLRTKESVRTETDGAG